MNHLLNIRLLIIYLPFFIRFTSLFNVLKETPKDFAADRTDVLSSSTTRAARLTRFESLPLLVLALKFLTMLN